MNVAWRRMLDGHQALQITVVGMVSAIALELLVNRVSALPWSDASVPMMAFYVLQCLAMFQSLVFVWLSYGQSATLIRWRMDYVDALFPFTLGAGVFFAIQWVGPGAARLFFWATGSGYLGGGAILWMVTTRRKLDPDSEQLVSKFRPGRIYVAYIVTVIWAFCAGALAKGAGYVALAISAFVLNLAVAWLSVEFAAAVRRVFDEGVPER